MKKAPRSKCSINLALEVFGDKWTLLIIRDIMLGGKRHFREFLQSDEHISSNILTNRLNKLEKQGVLAKERDPSHKQKYIYSLTRKGIDLLPVLISMAEWSLKHESVDEIASRHTQMIINGGEELTRRYMQELEEKHLHKNV